MLGYVTPGGCTSAAAALLLLLLLSRGREKVLFAADIDADREPCSSSIRLLSTLLAIAVKLPASSTTFNTRPAIFFALLATFRAPSANFLAP